MKRLLVIFFGVSVSMSPLAMSETCRIHTWQTGEWVKNKVSKQTEVVWAKFRDNYLKKTGHPYIPPANNHRAKYKIVYRHHRLEEECQYIDYVPDFTNGEIPVLPPAETDIPINDEVFLPAVPTIVTPLYSTDKPDLFVPIVFGPIVGAPILGNIPTVPTVPVSNVPEPSTLLLLSTGLLLIRKRFYNGSGA